MAQAQSPCPLIKAMMAEKPARLAGIGVTVNGQGLVDVTLNGKPDLLRGATDCSLTGPNNDFEVDCSWSFTGADSARAEAVFAAMRRRIDACLPERLEPNYVASRTPEQMETLARQFGTSFIESLEKVKILQDVAGSYPAGEDSALHLQLSLRHDTRYDKISLSATFSRY
jgi:hypothetical protein